MIFLNVLRLFEITHVTFDIFNFIKEPNMVIYNLLRDKFVINFISVIQNLDSHLKYMGNKMI